MGGVCQISHRLEPVGQPHDRGADCGDGLVAGIRFPGEAQRIGIVTEPAGFGTTGEEGHIAVGSLQRMFPLSALG